ncbi:hypothetical protein UlMin_000399 [Ulmus minor]
MEGKKQGGSSSSFTTELFGSKDSASSSGIFGSIFAPSSKVVGRESLRSGLAVKKQDSVSESSYSKTATLDDALKSKEDDNQILQGKDKSSIYQDQRVQPCHLSSSIYYGGPDIYAPPQSAQDSSYKKDGNEDDSERGNWWQGSLYY